MSIVLVTEHKKDRELFKLCAPRWHPRVTVWDADIPASVSGTNDPKKAWEAVGHELCRDMARELGRYVIMIKRSIRIPALGIGVNTHRGSPIRVDPVLYVKAIGVENLFKAVAAIGDTRVSLDYRAYECSPGAKGSSCRTHSVDGHLLRTGRQKTFDIIDTIFEPSFSYAGGMLGDNPVVANDPAARYRVYLFSQIIGDIEV